jgi:Ion channel
MTTVGYGDLYPHTVSGKIVAVLVMLVGIGFVALLTGSIAEEFIRPQAAKAAEEAAAERAQFEAEAHAQLPAYRGLALLGTGLQGVDALLDLRRLAHDDPRLQADQLVELLARADRQLETLWSVHSDASHAALAAAD